MAMYWMDLFHAIQFVQSQRFCVTFNEEMKGLLLSFHDIVQAQRDVADASHYYLQLQIAERPVSQAGNSSKRHFDDTIDKDMNTVDTEQMDTDRFEGRN